MSTKAKERNETLLPREVLAQQPRIGEPADNVVSVEREGFGRGAALRADPQSVAPEALNKEGGAFLQSSSKVRVGEG